MNQILTSERLYVTKKLRRRKQRYKIQFIVSLILVFVFSVWFIFTEIDKNSCEAVSEEILNDAMDEINDVLNDTSSSDEPLVIAMDDSEIEEPEPEQILSGTYTSDIGYTYNYESILKIPCLGIEYPVLSETTDELLKISLNKFWGGSPNEIGNYCVVGHNYRSGRMFGKLSSIKNGDIVKLTDLAGRTVDYKVYDRFVVDPSDTACTSQITNGLVEMTLITCTNGGKQRLIVKCRAV